MKLLRTRGSHDIAIVDSDGEVQDVYYGPDKGRNIVNTFYWYNDLQGRLKQEIHPPGMYHGQPRVYVKEDIEKSDDNEVTSHLKVYYGKKLLAYTSKTMPEYITSFLGYLNDEDLRYQVRTTINYLINEGGWKLHKVDDEGRFRRPKRSTPKKRKPVNKKPKKVVSRKPKKILHKKRK